jgi:uncharacterized coiled-coil protein SlyX
MKYRVYIPIVYLALSMAVGFADGKGKPAPSNKQAAPKPPRIAPSPGAAASGVGVPAVQRLMSLTPDERKKALLKLPPERRKQLEERLRQYEKLSAAQKDKIHALSPEQQAHLRRLYQRFNNFPPERQEALRSEVQKMQGLTDVDRRARMNSDEFRNRYNQREQSLLGELAKAVPSN